MNYRPNFALYRFKISIRNHENNRTKKNVQA
jgi:hypothetical protein